MKTLIKVALIALWCTAVNPGPIYGDSLLRLNMAHAWWTGTEEISLPPNHKPKSRISIVGVLGAGGKRYIPYEVGQSMLMLPGDWLGTQLHQVFPQIELSFLRRIVVSFLIFIPINVAAVVSCFWLLRLFDFEERLAGIASITWLLSTTVFNYAQVPSQNNQVLLFVTLGYIAALVCVRRGRPHLALFSGLALGTALLIRATGIIHVLTVFLFVVGCIVYQSRDKFKVLQVAGFWIVGFIPLALLGRVFDYIRYGSFWTSGQSLSVKQWATDPIFSGLPDLPANYPWITPPLVGIWGVLFSPAKSIFIYDPLLLPCLVLLIVMWKKMSPYIQWYLIGGIFDLILHIILTSRLDFWHGDAAWGARYHVTSVHLLLIPLIALFIQRILLVRGLTQWLMRGFLVLAIVVQISSVILRPSVESGPVVFATVPSHLVFRLGERVTNIACLINSSFSNQCKAKLYYNVNGPLIKKVSLLPFSFTKGRNLVFIVWGLVLIMAIVTTVSFCFVV
ncbi:hypothetical protein [Microseira wollei]|uniref:Glycosyltransferase RgtA/B/C/D-like domain-containing protein n=1 Tax=Microseira wollei NIES-4236 TaxID=2530354 RepID=A0AAV3X5E5_9CYAN|nr:hypothetical protein [Microseira wollei]GET37508.1 hypothetical protein MiSe_22610 [Microseira wollei NIES-4236]